jgi:glycosyltransferase involved in cell wall biosynthesis
MNDIDSRVNKDSLTLWKEDGSRLIQQNHVEFQSLIVKSKSLLQRGKYEAAAVYAQIAANYAQLNHCGFFVSTELEEVLLTIGRKTISSDIHHYHPSHKAGNTKQILHVSTNISSIGWFSRLMLRWIKQDNMRYHSVALTGQSPNEVPTNLRDAVRNSQGKIHILNGKSGGLIERARRLRECTKDADIVVLHTWEYDVVPMIAFANRSESPPIIYTNNGDHWFWVGTTICDVVANLRDSGMRLSQERRGIEPQRNLLLPTVLEPIQRVISRVEAKQQIGIEQGSIMLLSIARSVKYKTIDGVSFADAHIALLNQYKQAILIVVGPGDSSEDWSNAIQKTQGRIKVLGETNNTDVFYQAADIYVDSFPFVSITSILEAGCYGVPAVSRYPYASNACEILGADMPGLTGNLIRVQNLDEYTMALSRLVEDENLRLSIGELARSQIAANHIADNWQKALNNIYFSADTLSRVTKTVDFQSESLSEMFLGEPDIFLPSVNNTKITTVIHWHLALMPIAERLSLWFTLVRKYGFHDNPLNSLLPQKLLVRYYSLRSRLKSFLKKVNLL